MVLNAYAEPRRLALALPETRTTFAGASLVPDLAVYRWERIPRTAEGMLADDSFVPPEIASPGQARSVLARAASGSWSTASSSRCWSTRTPRQCASSARTAA
jgi:hypothetical protein